VALPSLEELRRLLDTVAEVTVHLKGVLETDAYMDITAKVWTGAAPVMGEVRRVTMAAFVAAGATPTAYFKRYEGARLGIRAVAPPPWEPPPSDGAGDRPFLELVVLLAGHPALAPPVKPPKRRLLRGGGGGGRGGRAPRGERPGRVRGLVGAGGVGGAAAGEGVLDVARQLFGLAAAEEPPAVSGPTALLRIVPSDAWTYELAAAMLDTARGMPQLLRIADRFTREVKKRLRAEIHLGGANYALPAEMVDAATEFFVPYIRAPVSTAERVGLAAPPPSTDATMMAHAVDESPRGATPRAE